MRWLGFKLKINSRTFWSSALVIGGLAFLNTWDFPMYVFLFSLVYMAWRVATVNEKLQDDEVDEENKNNQ